LYFIVAAVATTSKVGWRECKDSGLRRREAEELSRVYLTLTDRTAV
jgi:hypothetical protein